MPEESSDPDDRYSCNLQQVAEVTAEEQGTHRHPRPDEWILELYAGF
jgi:hypothetical protein